MTSVMKSRIVQALAPRARIARVIVAVAFAGLFTASCDNGITGPGTLLTLTISPNSATLAVNGTQQFTAGGTDATGSVTLKGQTWSVVAGGGTISSSGLFTAGTVAGTFTNTVKVACGGKESFATVIVGPGALATITVTPNPVTLVIRATQQFTAVGKDAIGNVVAITPTWSVVTAASGAISSGGLFTAGTTPGTYANTVKATSGTISGTATVTVTAGALATITVTPNPDTLAIGATQQFTAVGKDASGNVVPITPAWSVFKGGGTIISSGLFTAGTTLGTFDSTVTASSGTISGTATVVVKAGPLASITVTPNPAFVQTNATQPFTAVGKDAGGNVVPITPVWSIVAGGGTIISSSGLFTAGTTLGTFTNTVKATSGTISGFATVTVTPVLTSIVVTPNPDTLQANSTGQFAATGRDVSGNAFPITPVWSVVNGGGSIDSTTGLFTAGAVPGTFTNTVKATSGTISGFATVEVVPAVSAIADLGTAALNGIMAGQAVTCIVDGIIYADVSISPGNTITGFGPCVVTGTQHLADAVAAQAQIDLTTAYNTLFALPCGTNIVANLGSTTLPAGVYCSASSIGVTGPLTLDGGGNPDAKFVFQAGTSLTTAGDIILINGAQAKNVYWVVGSSATLGTGSQWKGNIVALTTITLVDDANLIGRALARNGSVTLGSRNVITLP